MMQRCSRSAPHRFLRAAWAGLALLAAAAAVPRAQAFPHVVERGETLASIAERTYGRVAMEQLLVAANGLDVAGGIPIVPGMRLEIPSVGHYRVEHGDTWAALAERMLGDSERSDVLATSNDSMPWLPPEIGREIIVPYNLRYVVGPDDTTLTIAYRFLGERDKAWMLDRYNRLRQKPVRRGQVILVPLASLELSAAGKAEAASGEAMVRSQGAGMAREAQRRADAELPQLAADLRGGRYVDVVSRGNRLLGSGHLARPQLAAVYRALTEAYVALDAQGLAETACGLFRQADPAAVLDPIELSPKILRACVARPPEPSPPDTAPRDAGGDARGTE